jgi:hypothetical protein
MPLRLILDESKREKLEKIGSRLIAIPGGLNLANPTFLEAKKQSPTTHHTF